MKLNTGTITKRLNPHKILIIRTDRIGDVILTLPVIDTLKLNYPDAKIDFLVNRKVFELVQDYPNINKVHAIEKDSITHIKKICKENDYDLAIAVRPLFVIALALFLAGVKYRLSTGYRWYSFLFNIKHYEHRKYSVKHELEYNLNLLDELGCKRIENVQPALNVNPEETEKVVAKLESIGVDIKKKFIIIHPGSLGSAKRWKSANFTELINMLINDDSFKLNIILTGTKDDELTLNAVEGGLKNKEIVYEITDLSLKEFAALCKMSVLFTSNSTGPIHIAAAVGAYCIGFYSPVTVESAARWGPYTERKKIFTPETTDYTANGGVMDKIKPVEVYEFIMNYISK